MIDEIVMLRHGRTRYNLEHRLQGQVDVPLDIVGQWQADMSGMELARCYYWAKASAMAADPGLVPKAGEGQRVVFQPEAREYAEAPASRRCMVVVSSDLFRARQTAHAFADLVHAPVLTDERLRERGFGRWEGMTRDEIRAMDAEAYDSWKHHTGGELAYGVEARERVGERGAAAVRDWLADPRFVDRPATLVLVSHGSWIVATIGTLLAADPDGATILGAMRNAFWCRLSVHRTLNGAPCEPRLELEEFNVGPAIADSCDWGNGPDYLRSEDMGVWRPVSR
ncbi:phosphoglycerate mutase [Bifidobacterium sp. DSM 109958]|uniref:Phosphoglycerate mutase n=1 Tax=Bifidobacterium moraviense TaxID=2675323 RepID=A0A7Y0HXW5_9BIFI|nr:histidine phosphatase family protein [Bifidobacterium sp. DSM 109958]NMM99841.1 phosphoglycerate mutase [Bifidobacterium sp. DSM 109958]